MPELVQNPSLVSGRANGGTKTAGAAITAGMPVYEDEATDTYKPSRANTLATSRCKGIALNTAATGQPVTLQNKQPINLGCELIPGEIYCVSADVEGGIVPAADYVSGDYPTVLGIANDNDELQLSIIEGETLFDMAS